MTQVLPSPQTETVRQALTDHCDLCGEPITPDEWTQATVEETGFAVCQSCIEEIADA